MNFRESCDARSCHGCLIIQDAGIRNTGFDPLAKIWSSVRKRIFERYGVDIVGIFKYINDDIICDFFPNFGVLDDNKELSYEIYAARFYDTFQVQMLDFEDVIVAFIDDYANGLQIYNILIDTGASTDELEKMFDNFLHSVGVKTKKDDKKKEKARKRQQKEKEKWQKAIS